ncbi:MAG: hypothetical protein ABIL49_05990 [candidate division WOR-3 bacterium]
MLTLNLIISELSVDALSYLRYSISPDSTLQNSFYIDRMYVNFKGKIFKNDNINVSFRFTTDVGQIKDIAKSGNYEVDTTGTDSVKIPKSSIVGSYYLYSKYAFIEIKYSDYKLYFGQTYNFWIKTIDEIWGYRFIEKTANDYFSVLSSADFGIAFEYKSKLINSVIGIYNGEGYNKLEDNKFKDITALLSIYPITNENVKVGIHGYGYYGKYKNEKEKVRLIGGFSTMSKYFRIGGEFSNFKGSTLTSDDTISSNIISAFLTIKPMDLLDLFVRFDRFKDSDNLIIGGVVLNITKDLRTSLNYKQYKEDKTLNLQVEAKF